MQTIKESLSHFRNPVILAGALALIALFLGIMRGNL
jgi:hypothetical protein